MKKYILPVILFSFAIVFSASAQNDKDLKGPAYKNKKPWKNPKPATTIVMKEGETKKGAGVKMMLPMERKTGETTETQFVVKKNTLKGPAYKNKKIWKDDSSQSESEELLAEKK